MERALQPAGDAKKLKDSGGSADAIYYFAGLAVEVALKTLIMRREGVTSFPDRRQDPDLYTHSLTKLAERAGRVPILKEEMRKGTDLAANWLAVRD